MHKKFLRMAMRATLPAVASLLFLGRAPAQYCALAPSATYPICTVGFADITASSSDPAAYVDRTATVGHVSPGTNYAFNISSETGYGWNITVFFDWDLNQSFETYVDVGVTGGGTCAGGVLTGTITVPPTALQGNTRMRIIASYSVADGYVHNPCGSYGYGQVIDYTLAVGPPPTCVPPTGLTVSNVGTTTASLSWTASTTTPSNGYQWEVRASGNPGDPSPAASGTTGAGVLTANATGLTPGTAGYKLYVRSDCGGGDLSSWGGSGAFETNGSVACGNAFVSPGGANNLTDQAFIRTWTACPTNSGDVVTADFATWNGLNWNVPQQSGLFIYDGNSTAAPLVAGPGTAYTCTGCYGAVGSTTMPAGGWTANPNTTPPLPNRPPTYTSTAANGCLTFQVYNYGIWTGGAGWSANITCSAPPTCFPPTARTITAITSNTASFSWNAGASPDVEYKVVAFGSPASAAAITSGTSSSGSATTAAVLTSNVQYTVYFRGLCDGGTNPSAWSSALNFRTIVGCGATYDLYKSSAYATYTPVPKDSVITICPTNAGDAVTLTVTKFSFGGDGYAPVGLFVHDGNSTAAPIFNSGLPAAGSGANILAAGAFRTNAYNPQTTGGVAPGPFTSTAANGCLTLHFKALGSYVYDQGMSSNVTCAPPPACSTPNAVSISNIGGAGATVSWGNTSQPSIVEYGPVGFTPGTGATAGTNGIIASSTASSPFNITGLSGVTTYDVYVRQICSGPTYSANSFRTRFTTSKDCSTAQVITCNQYLSDDDAPAPYTNGSVGYENSDYSNAVSCLGGTANANGPERFYRFTASSAGTYGITAGITDQGSANIGYVVTPVENGCAASVFTCIGAVSSTTGGILTFNVATPGDYYILSDANYVVHKRPFQLNCPGVPACVTNPTFPANGAILAVNNNPIAFSWPAVFGASSYDVYFQGSLVANVATNSISSSSYTTAAVKALVGLNNSVTWRVVPKNSFGPASCPTDWTFRVGGNGAANAVPLTENVTISGNSAAGNGYTNANTTYSGNDFQGKFTATACADSASVSLCVPANVAGGYMAVQVRKMSDNSVVFPPADNSTFYTNVPAGTCFQYSYFNYDPEVWNWVYVTPTFQVTAGETYYVIVDGYSGDRFFTLAYNEISNSPDSDGDGIPDCADNCPFTPGVVGDVCDPGTGFATGRISTDCECVGGNMAVISITTDANPTQLSWQVTNESSTVVASGSPTAAQANSTVNSTVFLAGSCYNFTLYDSFGDGLTGMGGWELRTTDDKTILRDDFSNGSVSPAQPPSSASYGSGHSFCLPLGPANIMATECGIFNNALGNKVYCNKVTGATQYQFEFSDPDAGFMRRIAVNRNYVLFSEMVANPLTPGVKYFARVRSNVSGPVASAHWGSGCEMGLGVPQVVTCSQLIQAPAYGHSCNETRSFNTNNSFIYAVPVIGGTEYQFRIFNLDEGYDQTFTRNTYILQLKWNNTVAPALVNGSTYNVQVNVKVNGVYTGFCPSSCTITIDNSGAGGNFASMEQGAFGDATLWPNPVRDGQVNLSLGNLEDDQQQIAVEVQDIYGKQVFAQQFGNSGERFSTILQLPGDLASGVYMVNITVNGERSVQRLSLVR
jgi:hypothetical protein